MVALAPVSVWKPVDGVEAPRHRAAVLVEKTPENFVRGLFLEALFPQNARFVFVLRHPLAWALTIEKWLDNRWNFKKTLYLRDPDHGIDRRIEMWIQLVDKMLADVSSLKQAAIVHAEACSLRPDVIPKSLTDRGRPSCFIDTVQGARPLEFSVRGVLARGRPHGRQGRLVPPGHDGGRRPRVRARRGRSARHRAAARPGPAQIVFVGREGE